MGKTIDSDDLLPKLWDYISDYDYEKVEKVIDGLQSTTPSSQSRTYGRTGWICPVCGRGLSPFTTVCPCRTDFTRYEVTC